MKTPIKFAILMTCHNRRETTLACLNNLFAALSALEGCENNIYLVDDGSTDGTGLEVKKAFPQVNVIIGDGSLYWAKGMALAWRTALADGDWDAYLWLNDDVMLDDDAILRLLAEARKSCDTVLLGALRDEESGERVYGTGNDGFFTGSFVWVPRAVYEKVGMLSDAYRHAWADYDYAHRCRRAGIAWRELEGTVGTIRAHVLRPPLKGLPIRKRWQLLWDPKGWCVVDVWTYRRRNYGMIRALFSCINVSVRVLMGR